MPPEQSKELAYWMGQIDGKLASIDESIKRVETAHGGRLVGLETRVIDLEASKNQGIGQKLILMALGTTVGGFIVTVLQKHF